MHPRVVLTAVVIGAAALTACGSDDAGDSTPVETTATPSDASDADDTDDATDPLSAEVICERLTVASVTADIGLDVTRATPDDSATPQCAYEYTNESGGVSNLTVASMRAEDVGGLTGSDAFDFVVGINESIAGDDAETQDVSAGDAALRISGTSLHVGVVQVSDRVLTLIIPVDDVESDAVDSLIATMATTLG